MRVNIIRPLKVLQCTLLHFGSHSSISVLSIVCASPLPFFFYLRLSSRLPLLCACGPHCAHHHHLLPGPIIHPERMFVDQKTPHGVEVFRFFSVCKTYLHLQIHVNERTYIEDETAKGHSRSLRYIYLRVELSRVNAEQETTTTI